MPEMGDNYLSAKLVPPKGGVMVKGCMTVQKIDPDSNPIGHVNNLAGKSAWNSAEFHDYSDSGPFELRNFHRNFIFQL
jgi:hypothetical protein